MRGNNVGAKIQKSMEATSIAANADIQLNDLFLHALFARLAFDNNETHEFSTRYDRASNSIELDIPDKYSTFLDQIVGLQRGPKLQQFIRWLIGSQQFVTQDGVVSSQFLSLPDFNIWFGASFVDTSKGNLSLLLPTTTASAINTSFQTSANFSGDLAFNIRWIYFGGGANTNWKLKCSATVIDDAGDADVITNEIDISTYNLIDGDIRSTRILDLAEINPNTLIDITLYRNYAGSSDPKTETIAVLGMEVYD